MKNITVAVADDVYRGARIAAAELGTSVSAMVAGYLEQVAQSGSRFERLKTVQDELFADLDGAGRGITAADRLGRDEVHERAALR